MRRLFIAINIPEDITERIIQKRDLLESLIPGAKFVSGDDAQNEPGDNFHRSRYMSDNDPHVTPPGNFHITLVFLGYQEDADILPIIKSMKDVVLGLGSPEIIFDDMSYAPPKGTPRMIWLNGSGETSENLSSLKIALEDELIKNRVRFKLENREFNSHITLARFTQVPEKGLLEIGKEFKDLNWLFEADSLDLMESHLSGKGAKYEVLQRIEFKK